MTEHAESGNSFARNPYGTPFFSTTGEIVRTVLPAYNPCAHAHGLWTRAWPDHLSALESEWKPYLDRDREFDAAIAALVDELAVDP